jgi:hypothetical protein
MRGYPLFALALIASLAYGADESQYGFSVSSDGMLPPARKDAYGPGMDSDATGRPFYWAPKGGPAGVAVRPDPTLDVKPDLYGPGTGIDQYGRPVERRRGF